MERSEVSIKTRSTPASLSFKGQATKHTTVKWSIIGGRDGAVVSEHSCLQKEDICSKLNEVFLCINVAIVLMFLVNEIG